MLKPIDLVRKSFPSEMLTLIRDKLVWPIIFRTPFLRILYLRLMYGLPISHYNGELVAVKVKNFELILSCFDLSVISEVFTENLYTRLFQIEVGDTVVDIGAHVGAFSLLAAKAVGERGVVVAIEPLPKNVSLLNLNLSKNRIGNVITVNKALGEKKQKAKLYLPQKGTGGCSLLYTSPASIEVDVDTLDNILLELGLTKVDFLKIDAEGYEPEILKGAKCILTTSPNIKISIAAYHPFTAKETNLSQLVSFLEDLSFKTLVYKSEISGNAYLAAARSLQNEKEKNCDRL